MHFYPVSAELLASERRDELERAARRRAVARANERRRAPAALVSWLRRGGAAT